MSEFLGLGREYCTEMGNQEYSGVIRVFPILIRVADRGVCTSVKNHQIVHIKSVHSIAYKSYLYKIDLN
jgi:hypothetical protein